MKAQVLLAETCALLLASPAMAQNPVSTADSYNSRREQGYVDGARELKRVSACAYSRNPGYVDGLLKSRPGSNEEGRILYRLGNVIRNCMNEMAPAMWLQNGQSRGAFAESRYLDAHPAAPDFSRLQHAVQPVPSAWTEAELDEAEKVEVMKQEFANCVVAADPTDADEVLRTVPSTRGEANAVASLTPHLGPCLQKGVTFTLDAAILRSLVAQGLERSITAWNTSPAASNQAGQ